MSDTATRINLALLDAYRDLPASDQLELAKFLDLLERRARELRRSGNKT